MPERKQSKLGEAMQTKYAKLGEWASDPSARFWCPRCRAYYREPGKKTVMQTWRYCAECARAMKKYGEHCGGGLGRTRLCIPSSPMSVLWHD